MKHSLSKSPLYFEDIHKYDKNGNKTEMIIYNPDKTFQDKYSFKYEYDVQNNWTKQIEFKNGVAISIVLREIEYY